VITTAAAAATKSALASMEQLAAGPGTQALLSPSRDKTPAAGSFGVVPASSTAASESGAGPTLVVNSESTLLSAVLYGRNFGADKLPYSCSR
jgi:hypothetical protein